MKSLCIAGVSTSNRDVDSVPGLRRPTGFLSGGDLPESSVHQSCVPGPLPLFRRLHSHQASMPSLSVTGVGSKYQHYPLLRAASSSVNRRRDVSTGVDGSKVEGVGGIDSTSVRGARHATDAFEKERGGGGAGREGAHTFGGQCYALPAAALDQRQYPGPECRAG